MKALRPSFLLFAFLVFLCSCENDYYVRRDVALHFAPTTQVTMLHAALNDLGAFVIIRKDKGDYVFSNAAGEVATWPISEREQKSTMMGISGFIVGRPVIGDSQQGQNPVCFELACPVCYENSPIPPHNLVFDKDSLGNPRMGMMKCRVCQRTFDLNVGNPGLERYRITYSGPPTNSLKIGN